MLRNAILVAAALAATTTAASAKFYQIQLNGYCNGFAISVAKGMVVGTAFGSYETCAAGNVVGTVVTLPTNVPPKGKAIALGWDGGPFRQYPTEFIFYFDLTTHYWTAYATLDGTYRFGLAGKWSEVKNGFNTRSATALPSIQKVFEDQAQSAAK